MVLFERGRRNRDGARAARRRAGRHQGPALFLLPKTLPDGTRNRYRIVRLKDKLGSRSMASGEIALEGAQAYLIGEIGRGFHQMADMINMSRLSNGVRAAGLMRRALNEALHVAAHREAFGRKLIEMPLMQRQLLKMLLPAEGARAMFMQIALLLPQADAGDEQAARCVRILTPLIRFRACRDARRVTGDAMEVRGGTGYIESGATRASCAMRISARSGRARAASSRSSRGPRSEHALDALRAYLGDRLGAAPLPDASRAALRRILARACDALARVADEGDDARVRQAASALYYASAAVLMACEACGSRRISGGSRSRIWSCATSCCRSIRSHRRHATTSRPHTQRCCAARRSRSIPRSTCCRRSNDEHDAWRTGRPEGRRPEPRARRPVLHAGARRPWGDGGQDRAAGRRRDARLGAAVPRRYRVVFHGREPQQEALALDLSRDEGRAILWRLLEEADVLVENFKPGTLARWGWTTRATCSRFRAPDPLRGDGLR